MSNVQMELEQKKKATTRPSVTGKLDFLPDEVLQVIFQHLDAITLTSVSRVSKRFLSVADEHLIWKIICLRSFSYWDPSHEIESRKSDSTFHDWKGLYAVRHRAHIATEYTLRAIIDEPVGRLARVQRICDHGYGIKDTLLQLYDESSLTDYALAQRYWTHTLLSCLNRSQALDTLTRVRYRTDVENPTELAIAALDMFTVGSTSVGDIEDTFRRLDGYVSAIRTAYPDIDSQSPRTKAVAVASFLRSNKWVGIDGEADYYSIEHQFLGYAVRSSHRNSIPLITCVIYCYVCRALGLKAQPCSYPNHVHAVIQPSDPDTDLDGNPLPSDFSPSFPDVSTLEQPADPPSELTHLYIDPFNTHIPIPLSTLKTQLTFIAPSATPSQRLSYLTPATPRSLLLRTANNILRSLNTSQHVNPTLTINDAAYAALFVQVLFPTTPAMLASNLSELRQHFAGNFIEDLRNYITYIAPLTAGLGSFAGRGDPLVKLIRDEDGREKTPKVREGVERGAEVKYRVGTVFRHRRQGYIAVVYGWDGKCEMGERWILGNGVDRLGGGRGQPFYNA